MSIRSLTRPLLIALAAAALLLAGLAAAQEAAPEPQATPEAASETPAPAEADASQPTALFIGARHLHSLVRWVVVLITLAAIAKLALELARKAPYDALTGRLMLAFSAGISVQWLVGLATLIIYGVTFGFGFRHLWEHAAVMTVAVAISHLHNRWKGADAAVRYRSGLITVVIALALVVIGVALLPQGWRLAPT